MANRKQIENRIFHIIKYIDKDETLQPLIGSINLFSLEELLQLLDFLETGNYSHIYQLLDKKIKEYTTITKEIKHIKIKNKMDNVNREELEEKETEKELEKILEIN